MTRSHQQPGPPHPSRIDSLGGRAVHRRLALPQGASLNDALTTDPSCGTAVLRGAVLHPFRYVKPGPPTDGPHVAYFSAPVSPEGPVVIRQANATLGRSGGKPFVHCHATWTEADGTIRGGHVLPQESFLQAAAEAEAWTFPGLRVEAEPDPETGFALFQPRGQSGPGNAVLARIKPNEDILTAIETIARAHAMPNAIVRGSLGSLIGARFADGTGIDDLATEVLVRQGRVRGGAAEVDLLVVDMQGRVHQGRLARGDNPVCITFDLVLESAP